MTLFQIVTLPFLAYLIFVELNKIRKDSVLHFLYDLRWVVLSTMAFVVVAFPEVSNFIAKAFGIARGVDIIIYFSIIWLFFKSYNLQKQNNELFEKLDRVIRELAVKNEQK